MTPGDAGVFVSSLIFPAWSGGRVKRIARIELLVASLVACAAVAMPWQWQAEAEPGISVASPVPVFGLSVVFGLVESLSPLAVLLPRMVLLAGLAGLGAALVTRFRYAPVAAGLPALAALTALAYGNRRLWDGAGQVPHFAVPPLPDCGFGFWTAGGYLLMPVAMGACGFVLLLAVILVLLPPLRRCHGEVPQG